VAGPDGNLWFTESATSKLGRVTTGGEVAENPVPTSASQPLSVALGGDGRIWFTEQQANQIGRFTIPIVTPTPTPVPPPRGHVTPVAAPTPRPDISGRQ
jgi:virginiamycin B lyase